MDYFIKLGATLFIPATHKDLQAVVNGSKYTNLKSVVVDTEDSISDKELDVAVKKLKLMLLHFQKKQLLVFIRPRNTDLLREILTFENIDMLDGFVLPKFSLENADIYLSMLQTTHHYFMPSIEGKELFQQSKLLELHEKLLQYKERIIIVRFGLEDMLRQLKMRRKCDESIFDLSVTSAVLGNFIAIFKSSGFEVSGGVYPCVSDEKGFIKDVLRDLKEGLFSKTIIHPNQIETMNELYKVTKEEFNEAREICNIDTEVWKQNSKMVEKKTMTPYANFILQRAQFYGVL